MTTADAGRQRPSRLGPDLRGCRGRAGGPGRLPVRTRTPHAHPRSSGTSHAAATDVSALVRQLDSCIHGHGSPNFPDPYIDANGDVAFPADAPRPTRCRSAGLPVDHRPAPEPGQRRTDTDRY